ncbi:MAG: hypothetical protein EKE20_14625 [Candidatus Symbiopectobacterium sp. Dall1.0]|nr:hypothetical protein [Candidatus Symbiopectobacterium sp. Dall1.0]
MRLTEMSKTIVLVDGDMVAFSHSAAEEYGKEDEDISFSRIQNSMDAKLEYISKRLQADEVKVFLSGHKNFRFVINKEYKSNRDGVWRPFNLENAKAHLKTCWDAYSMDGVEADDLLSCFAKFDYEIELGKFNKIQKLTNKGRHDNKVYIASLDKDLAQVGCTLYQWETPHKGEKQIHVEGFGELNLIIKDNGKSKKKEVKGTGAKFFLWQLLVGDGTDGILGCGRREENTYKTGKKAGQRYLKRVGVGAVEAYELLKNCQTYPEGLRTVMSQYITRFGSEWKNELISNGRLLYMVNNITDGNKALMWHYNTDVKEYFDLKRQCLVVPVEGDWVDIKI